MTIGNAEMAHLQMEAHKAMLAATNTKKPRRTAVERAAESLEKAKAKARARLLKLAEAKLEEARCLLIGAEDVRVYLNNQHETCSSWETVETIRDAIRAVLGE